MIFRIKLGSLKFETYAYLSAYVTGTTHLPSTSNPTLDIKTLYNEHFYQFHQLTSSHNPVFYSYVSSDFKSAACMLLECHIINKYLTERNWCCHY